MLDMFSMQPKPPPSGFYTLMIPAEDGNGFGLISGEFTINGTSTRATFMGDLRMELAKAHKIDINEFNIVTLVIYPWAKICQ